MPYTGIQYVAIPEFQAIGTQVGQLIAAALTGQTTVDEALKQAQSQVTGHHAAGRLHASEQPEVALGRPRSPSAGVETPTPGRGAQLRPAGKHRCAVNTLPLIAPSVGCCC